MHKEFDGILNEKGGKDEDDKIIQKKNELISFSKLLYYLTYAFDEYWWIKSWIFTNISFYYKSWFNRLLNYEKAFLRFLI